MGAAALIALLAGCGGHIVPPARTTMASPRPVHRPAVETAVPSGYYRVRAGDTFSALAARFGVSMDALARHNAVQPPYLIRVGQLLRLPPPVYAAPSRPAPRSAVATPLQPLPPGVIAPTLTWPVDGAVVAPWGAKIDGRANPGIDLAGFSGQTVRAAAAGKVIFAGPEPSRFGQLLVIDHGGGWTTAYGWLGALKVSEGQAVTARSAIAALAPGSATRQAALHFELRRENKPVDPRPWLPPRL